MSTEKEILEEEKGKVNLQIWKCEECPTTIEAFGTPKSCSCGGKVRKLYLSEIVEYLKNKDFEKIFPSLREKVYSFLLQKNPDRNSATEVLSIGAMSGYIFYSIRNDVKDETWVYDNGIYIPNGRSIVFEFCRKVLESGYTDSLARAVYNKIREDTKIEGELFFSHQYPDEIPILNGILNTKTKELSNFDSKKIFFNKIPVEFNPNAKCPKVEQFLKDVLAQEEDILVFYEIGGDALSKKYDFQKSIIQFGDGSNGKGISQSILKRFFGSENCASVSLNQMTYDSHSVAELFGKYMNLAGDLDRQALKETGIFKQLTSGTDSIQSKRKYLNDLKFLNFAKMVFACNEFPRVYDSSFGFWRRWIILNYPYKFISKEEHDTLGEEKGNCKVKNPNIFEEITSSEEMSGLLNEFLTGLDRIRKQKGYSITKGTDEIKNFWIRKSSPFTAFLMDCIEADFEGFILKSELRKIFSKYCKIHRLTGAGDKEIKFVLQDLFGATEGRKKLVDSTEYVWEGIKFKENYKNFLKIEKNVRETTISPKPLEKGIFQGFDKKRSFPNILKNTSENPKIFNSASFSDEELKQAGFTREEIENAETEYDSIKENESALPSSYVSTKTPPEILEKIKETDSNSQIPLLEEPTEEEQKKKFFEEMNRYGF